MDFPSLHITKTAQETKELAKTLATFLISNPNLPRVVCLTGDLGSGKTTFVQGFAEALGISDRIVSPTYIIEKKYRVGGTTALHHIDAYRLAGSNRGNSELVESVLASDAQFVLVEWPKNIEDALPKSYFFVSLTAKSDEHSIQITLKK